ncbi:Glutathione S-transferase [Hondaea fermentalgiana]|uniref:Glutathione S-transferase n=1 Tax=Hondaea fermentalgiana TaxID=2315210 RepID=A0A2R5GIW9_9STRA|nr:Glutathione S-transferase [Hondaea fermentalgiana]|eukprot:GBG30259.1 Glutathione S-transferase [Hondaea fermentalgiana]
MTHIKLTYFDMGGTAEKVRLAFILNGVDFEDERLKNDEWAELKPKVKFGQLPILQLDDGPVYAQSDALLRLAATMGKAKLMPEDPMEQLKVNEAMGLTDDIFRSVTPSFFMGFAPERFGFAEGFHTTDEGKAKVKAMRETWLAEEAPKLMAMVSALLEANGPSGFLASKDGPTIADCHMVSLLRMMQSGNVDHFPASCFDKYEAVGAYMKRFLAIPEVAKWYSK